MPGHTSLSEHTNDLCFTHVSGVYGAGGTGWPGQRRMCLLSAWSTSAGLNVPLNKRVSSFPLPSPIAPVSNATGTGTGGRSAATFFIDKVQSIFTNGIIFSAPALSLCLGKRIVICFPMHLLLFSDCVWPCLPVAGVLVKSPHYLTGISAATYVLPYYLATLLPYKPTRIREFGENSGGMCSTRWQCKAAFDRDLCLLVVLLIKMHFYCSGSAAFWFTLLDFPSFFLLFYFFFVAFEY